MHAPRFHEGPFLSTPQLVGSTLAGPALLPYFEHAPSSPSTNTLQTVRAPWPPAAPRRGPQAHLLCNVCRALDGGICKDRGTGPERVSCTRPHAKHPTRIDCDPPSSSGRRGRYPWLHLTSGDTEAQRGRATVPQAAQPLRAEAACRPGLWDSRPLVLALYDTLTPLQLGGRAVTPLLTVPQRPLQVARLLAQSVETSVQGGYQQEALGPERLGLWRETVPNPERPGTRPPSPQDRGRRKDDGGSPLPAASASQVPPRPRPRASGFPRNEVTGAGPRSLPGRPLLCPHLGAGEGDGG